MAEGSTFDLHVLVNETIYTTLKHKADKLGVTISHLVRAIVINTLQKEIPFKVNSYKFDD